MPRKTGQWLVIDRGAPVGPSGVVSTSHEPRPCPPARGPPSPAAPGDRCGGSLTDRNRTNQCRQCQGRQRDVHGWQVRPPQLLSPRSNQVGRAGSFFSCRCQNGGCCCCLRCRETGLRCYVLRFRSWTLCVSPRLSRRLPVRDIYSRPGRCIWEL